MKTAGAPVETEISTAVIRGYHAHVYFDAGCEAAAARLRQGIAARFEAELGRWHRRPIGPHPCWSYQVAFGPGLFATLVPWLALNRDGLTILIHPETGDALMDHHERALWLGQQQPLDLSVFEKG